MKNLFKKIGALLMAAVMVLSMCTAVFATNDPMVADHATIKGINKEDGITVKAYKIITYNENGTYSEVLENTIDKTEDGTLNPTSANIEALAKRTNDLTDVVNITGNVDFVSLDDGAAIWTEVVNNDLKKNIDRTEGTKLLTEAGYDISTETGKFISYLRE